MNRGIKYVECVVDIKDINVNNFCITPLPISAGDGSKYNSFFPERDHDFGQTDFQDIVYSRERRINNLHVCTCINGD